MAKTWLSVRVDLVEGHGDHLWPRPGRLFAASRTHSFAQLSAAIDAAFARWDLAHLHDFTLADGTRLTTPSRWDEEDGALDDRKVKLGRLSPGEQFVYVFDLGDDWAHLCTVGEQRLDPEQALGFVPDGPVPYWGWGDLPDQYRRRWDGDDTVSPPPPDPQLSDLPPLRTLWGDGDGGPRWRRSPMRLGGHVPDDDEGPWPSTAAARPRPPAGRSNRGWPRLSGSATVGSPPTHPTRSVSTSKRPATRSPSWSGAPPWRPDLGPEWSRRPAARIRWDPKTGLWQLYRTDRHLKFCRYEPLPPTPDIGLVLEEIGRDPTGAFWG